MPEGFVEDPFASRGLIEGKGRPHRSLEKALGYLRDKNFLSIPRGVDLYTIPRLGERLLKMGIIEEEHLAEALRVQRFSPRPLGDILCEMGVLWPEDLEEILQENDV